MNRQPNPEPHAAPPPSRAVVVLDVGNRLAKFAVVEAGVVGDVQVVPTCRNGQPWSLPSLPKLSVVGCSVLGSAEKDLGRLLRQHGCPSVRWVGRDLAWPLAIDYETPKTLGPDRVVACYAAWRSAPRDLVVIDAGSAITVDLVTADGVFRGGAIAPGFHALGAALRAAAPALELVAPDSDVDWPARSSLECCRLGVTAAARGLLRDLLEAAFQRLGRRVPVIATGGDGAMVRRLVRTVDVELRPSLVLSGLGWLASQDE